MPRGIPKKLKPFDEKLKSKVITSAARIAARQSSPKRESEEMELSAKEEEHRLRIHNALKYGMDMTEQQFLNANHYKLHQIANNSNGKSYFVANSNELISDLLNDGRYKAIQKSHKNVVPLIDWKYLLILIVLSLSAEWFIRKYNGLI